MRHKKTLAAFGLTGLLTLPVLAESPIIDEILVVGTRHQGTAQNLAVPVDILAADALDQLPDTDTDEILTRLVPSYNINQQALDDESTFVRPANLRGLPADTTLIFVNGKRRHRASVITFLGGGLSDGAHAPDIASIPAIALQRIEVLQDGASAQYGSDAVAGVINFVLRNDPQSAKLIARHGEYKQGDGAKSTLSASVGLPLGSRGAVTLNGEWKEQEETVRARQRDDAQGLIEAGNTHVRTPYAQTWGAPDISDDFKILLNGEIERGSTTFYGFANYAERMVEGGFYYRNPHTRSGIFDGGTNEGDPDDPSDDLAQILVVALDGNAAACANIDIVNNVPDAAQLAAVRASDNCYSFYETFPGGFTPRFAGDIEDQSLVAGWRGILAEDWDYDVSLAYGQHRISYFLTNTINPQLAHDYAAGQGVTRFNPGGHQEEDLAFNVDFTKQLPALSVPASLALGLEYRHEEYTIIAGDAASSFIYRVEGQPVLAEQGLGIGSNGYNGFPASIAGSYDTDVYAAYGDLRIIPSDDFYTDLAVRYEDYRDFGDTLNVKIASRWQLVPAYAIRGAVSTGFRAPTAGQANTTKVTTEFSEGRLSNTATLPASHPVAILKGAKPLEPEESVHVNLGLVFDGDDTAWSIDMFSINLTNRIGSTSDLTLTEEEKAGLPVEQVSFERVRYFTNDFDTETQGIDLRFERNVPWTVGDTILAATLSYLETRITDFSADILNPVDRQLIEESLPKLRGNFELTHARDKWATLVRARYFGGVYNNGLESANTGFDADEKWLMDIEASYDVAPGLTVSLGAENVFDVYPDRDPYAGIAGNRYLVDSPFGFNGAFYYARLTAEF